MLTEIAYRRSQYIKFITDLGTLTPIEKKFLLSSIYMTSETIDTFLQDQDEVLGLSTEELALIEESAVDKLYAARSHDHNDPIDTRTFFPAEVMDAFVLNPKHVKRRFQQRIKRDAKSRRKRNDK
jgi:hypothetical protein